MAIKVGTENKRNVVIAVVLLCVLAYLVVTQLMSGPPAPAPLTAPPRAAQVRQAPQTGGATSGTAGGTTSARSSTGAAGGPDARKVPGSGLDPALHLEKLAANESIEYAGSGRNIFSADSAPVEIEQAKAPARPGPIVPAVYTPPPIPQPPAIDLHYFGYSASKDGKKEAFLLHGDDIFEAAAGEIVNHRYKIVAVDIHSVQVTDLSYNNTQTLPLMAN
jgi:hypothetical protein